MAILFLFFRGGRLKIFTTLHFEKIAAIRDRFRHAGNKNPSKWMVSGEMDRQNYYQNSENQSKTVELGLA